MTKGNNNRSNKETRKPKKEKPKASGTSDNNVGKSPITVAGKKVK